MRTAILQAIRDRDPATLQQMLEAGGDPNGLDDEGSPYLLHVADLGDVGLAAILFDAGADIDATDDIGYSALHAAVGARAVAFVATLIKRGASLDLRIRTDDGGTALTMACYSDRSETCSPDLVRLLVDAGADVNMARADGWTPLMLLCQHGSVELVDLLLRAGADPCALRRLRAGQSDALQIARHHGREEIASLIRQQPSAERVDQTWASIESWFETHAPPCAEIHAQLRGASEAQIDSLEAALEVTLPNDLCAHLRRIGAKSGAVLYEYEGSGTDSIERDWRMLNSLLDDGTFDDGRVPHHPNPEFLKNTWWSRLWVPFAVDGGGNMYCVDLDPGEKGERGQVIAWEIHEGPVGPVASSFLAFLTLFRDRLESGELRYDAESGIFD